MEQLFIGVLNNAITVSALIIAIIVVRALGKKMPKWSTCILWGIVAVKLVIPVPIESVLSVIPIGNPIPTNIVMEANPQISSGISSVDEIVNPVISRSFTPDKVASVNPLQIFFHIGALAWITGMIVMLTYALTTYMLVRKRVRASVKIAPRVYECDDISDSFILGTIAPKVYLSSELSEEARGYILKHEFAHLSRRDHIWKPLGFAILSVYWFNPLCWIAYILLCKDIEYACDEKVTRNIEKGEKAEYCRVLLENSMPRKMIAACPVAFGGTDVKKRIKNVATYKRPAFLITVASIIVCAAVGVFFATSRDVKTVSGEQQVSKAELDNSVTASDGMVESEKEANENAVAGDSIATADAENTKNASDNGDEKTETTITVNGKNISVLDDAEKILADLGTPSDTNTDFWGKTMPIYKFDSGIKLSTYITDGKEYAYSMDILKEGINTVRNIGVGNTKDEMIAAYGEPFESKEEYENVDGVKGKTYWYEYDSYILGFGIENGKIGFYYILNRANNDTFGDLVDAQVVSNN